MGTTEPSSEAIRFNPAQYPPHIPISDDGEGAFIPPTALRSVHDELCRPFVPAPNRTAYEGESPPPYRSRSVGYLDHDDSSGWSQRNEYQHATSRRTHSMSSSNNNTNKNNKNTGKKVGVSAASSTSPLLGSSRSLLTSSPPPPLYHQYHQHHHIHAPSANTSRSPQVRTQCSRSLAAVVPIHPRGGPLDYHHHYQQQPARAAQAPLTPPPSAPSESAPRQSPSPTGTPCDTPCTAPPDSSFWSASRLKAAVTGGGGSGNGGNTGVTGGNRNNGGGSDT